MPLPSLALPDVLQTHTSTRGLKLMQSSAEFRMVLLALCGDSYLLLASKPDAIGTLGHVACMSGVQFLAGYLAFLPASHFPRTDSGFLGAQ